MSVKATSWAFEHSRASGNCLLVLLALADRANEDGEDCHPSISTLMRKTRLSESTVRRCIRELELNCEICRQGKRCSVQHLGELEVSYGTGKFGCNEYRIRYEARLELFEAADEGASKRGPEPGWGVNLRGCQIDTPSTSDTGGVSRGDTGGVSADETGGVSDLTPDTSYTSCTSNTDGRAREHGAPVRTSRRQRGGLVRGPDPNCYRDGPGALGVPQRLHAEFLELRTSRGVAHKTAESELDAFYERWVRAYTAGERRTWNTGADRFTFWRARHDESWPATQVPRAARQPSAASRARMDSLLAPPPGGRRP